MTATAIRPATAAGWLDRRTGGMPQGFWIVFTGMGIARAGWFVVPFHILYLSGQRQLDTLQCSLVMTAFGAGWALSQPAGSFLAHLVGHRSAMAAGAWAVAAAFLAFGSAQSPAALAVAAAATGISLELNRPAAQAATVESTPASRRPRALALLYVAMNAGRGTGCIVAGLLAGQAFWALFAAVAVLNLGFGAIVLACLRDTPVRRHPSSARGVGSAFADYRLIAFTAITVSFYLILLQSVVTLPVVIGRSNATPVALGLVLCAGPFAVAISQFAFQHWLTPDDPDGWRSSNAALLVCALGIATAGTGLAITGSGTTLLWIVGTSLIWILGEVTFLAVAPGVVAAFAPRHLRITYFGIWGCCQGAAAMCAPAISGLLIRSGGTELLWRTTATTATITAIACLLLRAHTQLPSRTLRQAEAG